MNFLSLTLTILLAVFSVLSAPAAFAAQPDIGFKGIGPRLGYVDPESGLDGALEFGVDFQLGEWAPQLKWDASLSYWSSTQEWGWAGRAYDWSLNDLAIRTGVNYHFLQGDWEPYAGGGLGLHLYSWDYAGSPTYTDKDDSELGFYIDGGIHHQFNKQWSGQAQLQFDFADVDQTAILLQAIYHLGK
ncbi:outer membrane beta-barrel protein [candidate division KSB1 bacterium]|nr:outer membrane beta-barrel protein [candidate division KSB1 bacterium]